MVDDGAHGFDFRQRERCSVLDDVFVGLFDEVREGFSVDLSVEIEFVSSVKIGK
jgi:hypothetical protein